MTPGHRPVAAGSAFVGACLTRYEAWPVTAALIGLAGIAMLRRGVPPATAGMRLLRLSAFPLAAILAFLVLSRATVGEWFVTGASSCRRTLPTADRSLTFEQVWRGLAADHRTMARGCSPPLAGWGVARRSAHPGAGTSLLARAHGNISPAVVRASSTATRFAFATWWRSSPQWRSDVGLLRGLGCRGRHGSWPPVLVGGLATFSAPPLSSKAPMVLEAQWDRPFSVGRQAVTRCLAPAFRRPDEKILASHGTLLPTTCRNCRGGLRPQRLHP